MIVNAIMPHIVLTIRFKKFCPGVFTGCFLIIPLHTFILYKALNGAITIMELILSVIVVGLILLGAIPVFKNIAMKIFNKG
jgi:cell division protein FtsW (lipid II flippase)